MDRDIDRLLRRVGPGDIAVLDILDLDRVTADALVEAGVVVGVPESGLPAAEGYSHHSGIPCGQGLVKNCCIGRTCIATGCALHLIRPLGFDTGEKALRRAGLDYWPRVKPRLWPDLATLEAGLPALGEAFFVSPDAPRTLWDVAYPPRAVLVFGRESVGLPLELRERHRDRLLRVPMQDEGLRSLNLSTCVGILVYEVLRQRRRVG